MFSPMRSKNDSRERGRPARMEGQRQAIKPRMDAKERE
jgi:hypothetical protein